MSTPEQKTCHGVLLPASAFAANKSTKDGLQTYCRDCQKKHRAAWAAENKERTRAYDKRYREEKRGTITGDGSGQALPPASDVERVAPGAVDIHAANTTAPSPALASPPMGEGGEPREEDQKPELPSTSTRAIDAAAEEDKPADFVGEPEDIERLTAQPATPAQAATTNTARFADLPHAAIVQSKTNPRTHFDQAFLAELAEDIKERGLLQPILVRPLPASRLEETSYAPPLPTDTYPFTRRRREVRPAYEIVAGEQRWRAAGLAGLDLVPALIRNLTDAQVLPAQLVENLRRRDLHPMEEAEGYERLRDEEGMTPDQIAATIKKSRAWVYSTLKLLDLEPECREAFYAGKLTRSTAELVSKRPPNLQIQLLAELTAVDHLGDSMSYRKAKEHVDNRYMLKLATAPFDPTDAGLVPAAGSCRTCPKRSGSSPELFGDVAHADTCTDPTCFATKKEAHYDRIKTAADARGQTVITGKEAKEIMPNDHTLRGYTRVDGHQTIDNQVKTLRKVLGDAMPTPVLLENPTTHEMVEVLPTAVVGQLLKQQGIAKPAAGETTEAAATRQGIEAFELAWRTKAIRQVSEAAAGVELGTNTMREIAQLLLDGLRGPGLALVADLAKAGKIGAREGVAEHLRTVPADALVQWLFVLTMAHDLHQLDEQAVRITAAAANFGIDSKDVQARTKAEIRKATSTAKVDDAAKAITKGRKPKPTKEEAAAAIAQQLQAAENPNAFKTGDRVKLKTNLRKGTDSFNTLGIEADVMERQGDRAWWVQPDNLSFPLTADYTEMDPL